MTTKTKSETLSLNLQDRLSRVSAAAQTRTLQQEQHLWQYRVIGNPQDEKLLLLPGGGADATAMFPYIEVLSNDFCVITPDIPATIRNLDDATQGLRLILAQEQIEQTCLLGISFGGLLAQVFIRRFPTLVQDWIITQTILPSKHLAAATRMQRNLMVLYPEPALRWMALRAYRTGIKQTTTPTTATAKSFWQSYLDELYSERFRRGDWLTRAFLTADYHTNHEFRSDDLKAWQGDMLIIESSHDEVVDEGDRGALAGMYPRAFVQTLWGYDHLAPILAADELAHSIQKFLLKEDLNES